MAETAGGLNVKSRAPVVAGLFYPDDRTEMEERLGSFGLKQGAGGTAAAIIAPHGAWNFSGAVAGAAFSAASGRQALVRVVILGNIHKLLGEGIFLSDSTHFETPLGNLPVDAALGHELTSCGTAIHINDIPHLVEHGIEVLLPFVKFCFPRCAIVPILIGGCRPALIIALARALRVVLEPLMQESLLVVSSNLAINASEERALSQAQACVKALEMNEPESFSSCFQEGAFTPCGGPAIAALLQSGLLKGKRGNLIPGSLTKTIDEVKDTVYYGGIAFI